MAHQIPSLRQKLDHGKPVGVVTLTDSIEKRRRDFYCGAWGEDSTRRRYNDLIAQWEAAGKRWPCQDKIDGITIDEVVQQYWRWAETYYSTSEAFTIKTAWKVLTEKVGHLEAATFGPVKFREVRQAMIVKGWNRKHINKQIHRLGAIFKWAASNELIPVAVYQTLKTMESLKRGRTTAPESKITRPVAAEHVDAIRPWVSRQVWALIELQRFVGARPGELLSLRPRDIDRSGDVWRVELDEHKTAHHGNQRTLYFGPQAQEILAGWLLRSDDAYLFSAAEAEDERIKVATQQRQTPTGHGNRAKGRRRKSVGDHYTTASYRRAIARAADQANRWAKGGMICTNEERLIPRWHPHQLRHTAATEIRKRFGLEAAQVVLGHSSARVTDAVYAERDQGRVEDVMRAFG